MERQRWCSQSTRSAITYVFFRRLALGAQRRPRVSPRLILNAGRSKIRTNERTKKNESIDTDSQSMGPLPLVVATASITSGMETRRNDCTSACPCGRKLPLPPSQCYLALLASFLCLFQHASLLTHARNSTLTSSDRRSTLPRSARSRSVQAERCSPWRLPTPLSKERKITHLTRSTSGSWRIVK